LIGTRVKLSNRTLKIAWITRSFLDYRIPVYRELNRLIAGNLHLVYSAEYVPERVQVQARDCLGERAVGMRGEWKFGPEDRGFMANTNFSIRYQPGLTKIIRRIKPTVLVCDGFFKWTLPMLLYRIRHGTPPLVVLYERTAHTERRAQSIRTLYRKFAIRFVDAMSCNGQLCKQYSISLGYPPERITLGHMAADTVGIAQTFESESTQLKAKRIRSQTQTAKGGLLFLYVGRLNKFKGVSELLRAWKVFQSGWNFCSTKLKFGCAQTEANIALIIVGSGPEETALREQATGLGLRNVQFVGSVDYHMVPAYYAAADAFIIPTLEDNWSMVVPEAMACRLPILCSKYNGCWPELVDKERNGWIFNPLDQDDFVGCLEACVAAAGTSARSEEYSTLLQQMGWHSRAILQGHTPTKAAQAILEACHLALSQ
jgi:glycosyltransferase involved in cell wall biosynthesis